MDTEQLLLEMSALCGISGGESELHQYAADLLRPYGAVRISPLGGILCAVREPEEGGPHILLDAHIDEIGLVVTYIEEKGFLRVAPVGGIDRRLLLASPVIVHAESGPLNGVVCSIPPHLQGEGERKNPKAEDIYIDVGLDRAECEEKIRPGDRVTLLSEARTLLGGQVSGKALDDRAGCAALLFALECLGEAPCGLTVQFSSLEEVGCMGAGADAYAASPTHAVVVDVSFAHTPDAKREKCGLLGEGPMIGYAPILDYRLSERLVRLAERENIPFQREVMGGRTGTNADTVVKARAGVRTALVSIPQKYMHTPIEVVAVSDVEQTGRLIAALIREIAEGGMQS